MKRSKYYIFSINTLITLLFFTGCIKNITEPRYPYYWEISIENDIKIDRGEATGKFSKILNQNEKGERIAEIIIYGYSSVKETFFYQGETSGEIPRKTESGRIEALLKIKNKDKCIKVIFFQAAGDTKDELLENLALQFKEVLN